MARIPYICLARGTDTEAKQRADLAAAGLTADELADAYIDRVPRKLRPGEARQPQRAYLAQAARDDDEAWVSRPGIIGTTTDDALGWLAELAEGGTALHVASTGRRYSATDPASMIRLAADIAADARAMTLEKARRAPRKPRQVVRDTPQWAQAKALWSNVTTTAAAISAETGIPVRVLYREFGPRGTPLFGRVPQRKKRKRT